VLVVALVVGPVVGRCVHDPALLGASSVDAMRKTVTLEPDLDALIRQVMRGTGAPFKRVVNDALRRGLTGDAVVLPEPFVQRVFDAGEPLVDQTQAGALADEPEDQALIAKLAKGR
jgi:hypothetical protein